MIKGFKFSNSCEMPSFNSAFVTAAEADEAAKPQSPGKQESHPIPESG